MKQLINLTNDEIHNRFHRKFISLNNASDIVEPNSFMLPVKECLIVHLGVEKVKLLKSYEEEI